MQLGKTEIFGNICDILLKLLNTDSKPISLFAERHMKKPLCISAKHIKTQTQLNL